MRWTRPDPDEEARSLDEWAARLNGEDEPYDLGAHLRRLDNVLVQRDRARRQRTEEQARAATFKAALERVASRGYSWESMILIAQTALEDLR